MNAQKKTLCYAILVSTSMLLAACNDDDPKTSSSTPTAPAVEMAKIEGVAATGKPFIGKVEVVNAQGKKSNAVTINADGTFSVDVPKGAPYLIRAFNDNSADTLYSYAVAAGYANVTQLTTAALYDANSQLNLADLYTAWAEKVSQVTEEKVLQAAKEVVANLKNTMLENGLTTTEVNSLNVFNYKFAATANNKFDNFLDDVQISYTCGVQACNVSYTVNDQTFSWNYNIGVNGITIDFNNTGGGIPTGDFNLKVTTTVAGIATTVNIPKIPKPSNQQEFCGGQDVLQQLPNGYTLNSCSFSGNTGTIAATINQAGFSISYSVKYEYTPA